MSKLELNNMKAEADELGITYSPNIGLETLRQKIIAFQLAKETIEEHTGISSSDRAESIRKDATKLVRIRLTCMNIAKQSRQGDWFMGGNSITGTLRKYVPFNVPWLVPQLLLNIIEEKEFTVATNKGNDRKFTKEFQIEYLPELSVEEIHDLKQQQQMKAAQE